MNLDVDLLYKWNKEWNNTLISILHVVNAALVFSIVVLLEYFLACWLSRLFPAF